MVCIFCKNETKVTNSRPQVRNSAVWRRRLCLTCEMHFTTNELPDYEKSLQVIGTYGKRHPLNRDRLFLSIHKSLGYRKDSIDSSSGLTRTIISRLLGTKYLSSGTLNAKDIAKVSIEVLKRFDPLAAATYKAYHQTALKS
jgi:transcriptional regulator NrdR family protein